LVGVLSLHRAGDGPDKGWPDVRGNGLVPAQSSRQFFREYPYSGVFFLPGRPPLSPTFIIGEDIG